MDAFDEITTDAFDEIPTAVSPGEHVAQAMKALGRGASSMAKLPGQYLKIIGEGSDLTRLLAMGPMGVAAYKLGGDKLKRQAVQAGENIIAYYNKGIQGNLLAPSDTVEQALSEPFMQHPVLRTTTAVAESAPPMIAALATTLLTKNPNLGLALMGTQAAGQSYEDLRNEGINPDVAALGAAIVGSIEAATEKIPFGMLFNKSAKPILVRFLKTGSAEALGELMAQLGQNYTSAVAKDYKPEDRASIIPALDQEWSTISQGWQDAMAAGFVMGGGATLAMAGQNQTPTMPQDGKTQLAPVNPQAELANIQQKANAKETDINPQALVNILDTHNAKGGSTVDLKTGKPVTEGFAAAISRDYEQIIPGTKITPEQLAEYAAKHHDVLAANPRNTIGTWVADGKTYIDISTVVPTKEEAIELGKKHNQLAVFDLENFAEIPITTPETEGLLKKVYMKGFAARLTSIRNNADNVVAGAGNKQSQINVMKEELAKVQQHYASIADDLAQNPDSLAELTQINSLLPAYATAVNDFTKAPSKEGFKRIKEVGDKIAEFGTAYGERVTPSVIPVADEVIGKLDTPAKKRRAKQTTDFAELLDKAMLGDTKAQEAIQKGEYLDVFTGAPTEALQSKYDSNAKKREIHILARKLHLDTESRRNLMETLTGKRSAGMMSDKELDVTVAELEQQFISTKTGESIADQIAARLPAASKEIHGLKARGWKAMKDTAVHGLRSFDMNMHIADRLMEALDGKRNGALQNTVFAPVVAGSTSARVQIANTTGEFVQVVKDLTTNKAEHKALLNGRAMLVRGAIKGDPEIRLTSGEKIGVYLASLQKAGMKHLRDGTFQGWSNPDSAIIATIESLSVTEKTIGDWILAKFKEMEPSVKQTYEKLTGQKFNIEAFYSPLYVADPDAVTQTDFMSDFEKVFGAKAKTSTSEVKARSKTATQAISVDAFQNFFTYAEHIHRYLELAPAIKLAGQILHTPKLRAAMNQATDGLGARMLDNWLKDTARGTTAEIKNGTDKAMLLLRRNAVLYALVGNAPSTIRQYLSGATVVAGHPLMGVYWAKHMMAAAKPGYLKNLESFIFPRSAYMHTRISEDVQAATGNSNVLSKLKGKKSYAQLGMWDKRMADRHTTLAGWMASYEGARDSDNIRKIYSVENTESGWVKFADQYVQRTQSTGEVEFKPGFHRGSALAALFSTFQSETSKNYAFWKDDIVGARARGEIGNSMAAYRMLTSYVIPALVFGMIGRGGPPESWKDAAFDLTTYPLGVLFLVGRVVTNGLNRFSGGAGIEMTGLTAAEKLIGELADVSEELVAGETEKAGTSAVKALKYGAHTVFALKGYPRQVLTTEQGIEDLATGKTEDYRRLLWSQWSLGTDSESKKVEVVR